MAGVTFQSFKGSFALGGAGTQSITAPGFQGKLVVFWGNSATAQDTVGEANRWFFGAATAADNERVSYWASDDAAATMNCGRGNKTDACISIPLNGTPADDGVANFLGFTPTGFDINVSDAPAGASIVHYWVLGGDDIEVALGGYTTDTDTGNQSITGVGFAGDLLLQWSTGQTTVAAATHYRVGIGAATSADREWTVGIAQEDAAAAANTSRDNRNDACLSLITHAGVDGLADFTRFTADGWDQNWSDAPSAAILVSYIVIKGVRAVATWYPQPTTDTTTSVSGGTLTFTPETLFMAAISDTNTGFEANSARISVGASDTALNQGFTSQSSTDAAADSVEFQVTDTDKGFGGVGTTGVQSTIHIDSYTPSNGFTITTVGTSTAILNYIVAISEAEPGGGGGGMGGAAYPYYYRSQN